MDDQSQNSEINGRTVENTGITTYKSGNTVPLDDNFVEESPLITPTSVGNNDLIPQNQENKGTVHIPLQNKNALYSTRRLIKRGNDVTNQPFSKEHDIQQQPIEDPTKSNNNTNDPTEDPHQVYYKKHYKKLYKWLTISVVLNAALLAICLPITIYNLYMQINLNQRSFTSNTEGKNISDICLELEFHSLNSTNNLVIWSLPESLSTFSKLDENMYINITEVGIYRFDLTMNFESKQRTTSNVSYNTNVCIKNSKNTRQEECQTIITKTERSVHVWSAWKLDIGDLVFVTVSGPAQVYPLHTMNHILVEKL